MSDQYQWWRLALAGRKPDIDANTPQSGYYKIRDGKGGPWLPVAIWRTEDGELKCRRGAEAANAHDIWTWCGANPVAKADAKHAFEHGSWPGDVPASIGDNSGDVSLADELKDVIASALSWFKQSGIRDAATKDMAANYRNKILKLGKEADAKRKAESAPYEEKIEAIDAVYKPVLADAKTAVQTLRDAMTAWMTAEEDKAKAKAAEAARIENEKRMAEYRKQQEAAAKAAAEAKANEPPPPPVEAPVFVAPAPVKIQAGGQNGRKASLRSFTRYRTTDYAAALAHSKDHPDVIAAVEKVCFAQARAGAAVPGVESYVEREAV